MRYGEGEEIGARNNSDIPPIFKRDPEPIKGREADAAAWARKLAAARAIRKADPSSMLCIVGGFGTGKTALACRLLRDHHRNHSQEASRNEDRRYCNYARYVTATRLLTKINDCYGTPVSVASVMDRYAKVPLLALDELGSLKGSAPDIRVVSELIDARWSAGLGTMIVSNQSLDNLMGSLSDSAADRIGQTESYIEIKHASFRTGGAS